MKKVDVTKSGGRVASGERLSPVRRTNISFFYVMAAHGTDSSSCVRLYT